EYARFKGAHSLSIGGEIRRQTNDVAGQPDPRGSFSFTGAASGMDLGDFLLGLPHTSSIAFGTSDLRFHASSYAAYLTDDWHLRPSMTLNVGLRWEYEAPVSEERGRIANLAVTPRFTAVTPNLPTTSSATLIAPDKGGWEPRLGFTWRP